jgi:hypothetical protein
MKEKMKNAAILKTVAGIPSDDDIRLAVMISVMPPMNISNDLMLALDSTGPCLWEAKEGHPTGSVFLMLLVGVRSVEELQELQNTIKRIKKG